MFCHYGLKTGKWNEDCEFDLNDWHFLLNYLKENQNKFGDFGLQKYKGLPKYKRTADGGLLMDRAADGHIQPKVEAPASSPINLG